MSQMKRVNIKPGMKGRAVLPYSEVRMHMRVAGTTMSFEVIEPVPGRPMVQLYDYIGCKFSSPITPGEAGIYREDNGALYYYTVSTVRDALEEIARGQACQGCGTLLTVPGSSNVKTCLACWGKGFEKGD